MSAWQAGCSNIRFQLAGRPAAHQEPSEYLLCRICSFLQRVLRAAWWLERESACTNSLPLRGRSIGSTRFPPGPRLRGVLLQFLVPALAAWQLIARSLPDF